MRALLPFLCFFTLIGCNAPAGEPTEATSGKESPGQSTDPGVAPMGGGTAAGGIAPVQGSESVTGAGGGGTGQAAKGMARRAAGSAGGPAGGSANETAAAEESGE